VLIEGVNRLEKLEKVRHLGVLEGVPAKE
jgi:hypothetical protein